MKPYTMIALTLLALLAAGCVPVAAAAEPTIYRGGPQRTGVYDTEGVPALTGVAWTFETGDEIWSSPVIADGVVYFGSDDDHLYAVDAQTGQERWRFQTGGDVRSSPAVAYGRVYVGSYDGYLYAVDAQTGQEAWKFNLAGDFEPIRPRYDDYASSPLVIDGVVYIAGFAPDRCVVAVDAQTGEEKWHLKAMEVTHSSPSARGDTLYIGGEIGATLYALDIQTGEIKWTFSSDRKGMANYAPAIGEDGTIYFGSKDTYFYAVEAETGEVKWGTNLAGGSWVTTSPALFNGTVYAGTSDGQRLFAIDMETGVVKWEFTTGGWTWSSPAVAGGIVYVGGGPSNRLYAVDAESGEEVWQFETEAPVYSSPLVADGVVYFGSLDGNLYAVR